MEKIVKKIENINMLSETLLSIDKTKFNEEICHILTDIDNNVDQIYQKLAKYVVANDCVKKINNDKRRQKVLWKMLFPQYWYLTEKINDLTDEELDNFETKLANNNFETKMANNNFETKLANDKLQ